MNAPMAPPRRRLSFERRISLQHEDKKSYLHRSTIDKLYCRSQATGDMFSKMAASPAYLEAYCSLLHDVFLDDQVPASVESFFGPTVAATEVELLGERTTLLKVSNYKKLLNCVVEQQTIRG